MQAKSKLAGETIMICACFQFNKCLQQINIMFNEPKWSHISLTKMKDNVCGCLRIVKYLERVKLTNI